MTTRAIWVAGYPSTCGGADTELHHNIILWRRLGIDVHLVQLDQYTPASTDIYDTLGCHVHSYTPKIFKNKIVVSFCNSNFLESLPDVMKAGKPKKVIWFNCMTWLFTKEIYAHQKGWIDYFGFVSSYQEQILRPMLEQYRKVNKFEGYQPYFDYASDKFEYRKPSGWIGFGRISRDDGKKYSSDMWDIFYKITTPLMKRVFILGFGDNAKLKCGLPPSKMNCTLWQPNEISTETFYKNVHCIVHKTGGSKESYCRIVPECYAYGVPIIVEKDYAFPELIIDGETGFMCSSSDEMSFRASQLAFDENLRKKIIYRARQHLEENMMKIDTFAKVWEDILK